MEVGDKKFADFKTDILHALVEIKQEFTATRDFLRQEIADANRNTQDLLMQEIRASEHRTKIELHKEISQAKQETIDAVAEILDVNLLPQLDDHERRLTRLETKPA